MACTWNPCTNLGSLAHSKAPTFAASPPGQCQHGVDLPSDHLWDDLPNRPRDNDPQCFATGAHGLAVFDWQWNWGLGTSVSNNTPSSSLTITRWTDDSFPSPFHTHLQPEHFHKLAAYYQWESVRLEFRWHMIYCTGYLVLVWYLVYDM